MRIAFLADTHNYTITDVPDGDMVVHGGDATGQGSVQEVAQFLNWFGALPHRHKIFVAGNHDWLFERQHNLARQMCIDAGVIYLEDQGKMVEGLHIYGTPWQPAFCDWAFNLYEEEDLIEKWAHIPGGLDLLITHCPPFGHLDESNYDFKTRRLGCKFLRERVDAAKPKVHVFGHIHPGYGQKQTADTLFINAATCTNKYQPTNPPIWIDL